ncbi:MAG TPA: hypothetical protein VFL85_01625 [Candidatus Saccharimonadales bacterium]|nr:hypothetical protein [Candidatus Saccharimonadales bacterium]
MQPSYDDVAGEDNNWTLDDIERLHRIGMNTAEIALELHLSSNTIAKYLVWLR